MNDALAYNSRFVATDIIRGIFAYDYIHWLHNDCNWATSVSGVGGIAIVPACSAQSIVSVII